MPSFFERSCDNCRKLKIRCDRMKPSCKNCSKRGSSCTRNKPLQKRGPKPKCGADKIKTIKTSKTNDSNLQNTKKNISKNKFADISYQGFSDDLSDINVYDSEDDRSIHSLSNSEEMLSGDENVILSSELDNVASENEMGYSLSDESFENPSTPENHGNETYFQEKPQASTSEPFPFQEVLFFTGGKSETCQTYGYSDIDSRIDTPFTVKATIQNDLVRFEKSLNKAVPEQLSKQQADYLLYYFTHIQPLLPLVSQHRFLNLLLFQDANSPSEASDSSENNFQSSFKTLVSALCQVSYLFALNPNLFQHSILTFLAQTNLDILFSGEAAPVKLPAILTNALVMLIRYHLTATAI